LPSILRDRRIIIIALCDLVTVTIGVTVNSNFNRNLKQVDLERPISRSRISDNRTQNRNIFFLWAILVKHTARCTSPYPWSDSVNWCLVEG